MICSVVVRRRASSARARPRAAARPTPSASSRRPMATMPPARRISSSLPVSGTGVVGLALRLVDQLPRLGIEAELVVVRASRTASGLCTTCSPRLSAFRRKMSPRPAPQTITSSRPTSSATPLSPAGLISREDPMAKRSPAITNVSPRWTRGAEIRHQVAERARLPALVERVEALRYAVGGGRDLIRVNGVELLLLSWHLEVPENQGFAADGQLAWLPSILVPANAVIIGKPSCPSSKIKRCTPPTRKP